MLPHCAAILSPFSVHLLLLTLGKYMIMMMMTMNCAWSSFVVQLEPT